MGKVIIQESTTHTPLALIGYEAGVCYGTDITDQKKNVKRGKRCVLDGHGRVLEFPQVYMTLEGYSAKVIREFYTHIGGSPTRLQESTRYIDYQNFEFVVPPTIKANKRAEEYYLMTMDVIKNNIQFIQGLGIPNEDASGLLPLMMKTSIVYRGNTRELIEMSHQRLCSRAYWEYRQLMNDIVKALSEYSEEWKWLCDRYMKPKCEIFGYCTEHKSCGRMNKQNV